MCRPGRHLASPAAPVLMPRLPIRPGWPRTEWPSHVRLAGCVLVRQHGQQELVALFHAPQAPLFLAMVYAMYFGLGHTILFGVALAAESLIGQLLRAAGEAEFSAQQWIEVVMQYTEVVEVGVLAAVVAGQRGALRYLFDPIIDSFNRAFKES